MSAKTNLATLLISLKIFFDWLSSIVANSKKFEQLLEVNNYEEFMKEIIA